MLYSSGMEFYCLSESTCAPAPYYWPWVARGCGISAAWEKGELSHATARRGVAFVSGTEGKIYVKPSNKLFGERSSPQTSTNVQLARWGGHVYVFFSVLPTSSAFRLRVVCDVKSAWILQLPQLYLRAPHSMIDHLTLWGATRWDWGRWILEKDL